MNFIEERIRQEGCVKSGDVLKVDAFLNHQIDMELVVQIAQEFVRRFGDRTITKVLTIETSGIILAGAVARLLKVPMVIARKTRSMNLDGESYVAEFLSFNHKNIKTVVVSKKYLSQEDHVLIIDDIMANGCAMQGLISFVEDAEAKWLAAAWSSKSPSRRVLTGSGIWATVWNPWRPSKAWMPKPARSSSSK